MKNHFHLMVRMKGEPELIDLFASMGKDLTGFQNLSGLVSHQYSRLFNAYAKSFNLKYDRIGGLFNRPVKRKQITSDAYFTQCIVYIHRNPVHHGFVDSLEDWDQSSYLGIVNDNDPIVPVAEVLSWFGGKDKFIESHKSPGRFKSVFD
ncbi:MAG: hypothetical protein HC819_04995 [Cyclobacteriaceae bacterium]|nr:hypothetical protein [Cyclobacteriaceae bacterium]